LKLQGLAPLGYEADLFIPETEEKGLRLQEAADRIRGRFGIASLTSGMVLAASKAGAMLALPKGNPDVPTRRMVPAPV
jgi:DNA polymerase-4